MGNGAFRCLTNYTQLVFSFLLWKTARDEPSRATVDRTGAKVLEVRVVLDRVLGMK